MKSIKQAAKTLKSTLESMGYKIPMGHSLDLIAKLQGTKDWNALSAVLKMEPETPEVIAVPKWDGVSLMSDAQYLGRSGCHCPVCGSGEIEGYDISIDGGTAYQEMGCNNCNSSWNDIYTLIGYADLKKDDSASEISVVLVSPEAVTKVAGHVSAEAHSDDRAVEVEFNASSWLASASEKKIVALACCEWGGDYAADQVVHDLIFDGKSPLSDDLNEILKHGEHMARINKTVGFECTVDEDEAMQWLRAHRRGLWTAIKTLDVLEGVGIDVDEDSDQPGLWLWTAPTDSCEMSLPSFSEAALDAWQGLVATTMGANNLSTEQWEALSFDQQLSQVYDCCANA